MIVKRYRLRIKETIATVICEEGFIKYAEQEVLFQRSVLKNYISKDSLFLHSLKPYKVKEDSPEIVKRMSEASLKAEVGPMACVAGAIADYAVRAMINRGAKHAIFENGGDIAMFINEPVNVGIYSGTTERGLTLKIKPRKSIIGICTSSGKMGHSLSFGNADSATVISEDPLLADAVATALCNSIKEESPKMIEESIRKFLLIPQVEAIIVVMGKLVGLGGELPEIFFSPIPSELITKAY